MGGEALFQAIPEKTQTYEPESSSAAHCSPCERKVWASILQGHVHRAREGMRKLTWGSLGLQLAGHIAVFFRGVQP